MIFVRLKTLFSMKKPNTIGTLFFSSFLFFVSIPHDGTDEVILLAASLFFLGICFICSAIEDLKK